MCSKGSYIRTLAEDLGEALGCGAHLLALRRSASGGIALEACTTLQRLEALEQGARLALLRPVDTLLAGLARVTLNAHDAGRFLSGLRRRGSWPDAAAVAVYGEQPHALLGVGRISGGELIAQRLLSPLEIEQILQSTPHASDAAFSIATP